LAAWISRLRFNNVRKLDENTYSAMTGLKYKLAHKRAGRDTWSTSEIAQRRHFVKILEEMIDDLRAEPPVIEAPARRAWGRHVAARHGSQATTVDGTGR
jgi:hypothetical protein